MDTREHEADIGRAATANVDVMQATNYPRVSNDEGYGQIVTSLQGRMGRDSQREYEAALATVRQPRTANAAPTRTPAPPAPRATARAAAPAAPPPPPMPAAQQDNKTIRQ
jgi:hypothetical protein